MAVVACDIEKRKKEKQSNSAIKARENESIHGINIGLRIACIELF